MRATLTHISQLQEQAYITCVLHISYNLWGKNNVFNYLGEIPWENSIIVLRDTNFHICPSARRKEEKHLQLQDRVRLRFMQKCVSWEVNEPQLLTVRARMCIGGAPPSAMSLCERSKNPVSGLMAAAWQCLPRYSFTHFYSFIHLLLEKKNIHA